MESLESALLYADLLYGIDIEEDDAIELAFMAYNKIGKKLMKLHRFIADMNCETKSVELPCNCEEIEAVTYVFEDWNYTTNKDWFGDWYSLFTEHYSEALKRLKDPIYASGKFVKYERVGDTIYINDKCGPIQILYKGELLGEDGLPLITDKLKEAIACFIAAKSKMKEGLATHNQMILLESQLLDAMWLKLCDLARVEHLSQNDVDKILDAHSSFNRKRYGKSLKPV